MMIQDMMSKLSYGVYAVSTFDAAHQRAAGCIANSVMQVTSGPVTVALSINRDNHTNACIKEHGTFAISVLSEETDPGLISALGFRSGRDGSKFDGVPYEEQYGLAIPDGCCGYLICTVIDFIETASHTLFLGEVIDGSVMRDAAPMTYAYYHNVMKGKTPKNAPTYENQPTEPAEEAWRCTICGYTYDGQAPFETLPEDYRCPICGAPKSKFEKS